MDLTKQENKNTLIILAAIVLIALFCWWVFMLSDPEPYIPRIAEIRRAPSIDFDYIETIEFDYFHKYEEIEPLPEEQLGRSNPFLPY